MSTRLSQHLLYTVRDWFLLLQRVRDDAAQRPGSGLRLAPAR